MLSHGEALKLSYTLKKVNILWGFYVLINDIGVVLKRNGNVRLVLGIERKEVV